MSWYGLRRINHLLPYLQNPHHVPSQIRRAPEAFGYVGCFNCSIWGSILKREISSGKSVNYKRQFSLSNSARCYDISCSFPNFQRKYSSRAGREQKSQKILLWLTGLVFAMVGCTYAAVPLYRRFCQATGYGGTVQRRESVEEKIARHAQDGTVTTRCSTLTSSNFFLVIGILFLVFTGSVSLPYSRSIISILQQPSSISNSFLMSLIPISFINLRIPHRSMIHDENVRVRLSSCKTTTSVL